MRQLIHAEGQAGVLVLWRSGQQLLHFGRAGGKAGKQQRLFSPAAARSSTSHCTGTMSGRWQCEAKAVQLSLQELCEDLQKYSTDHSNVEGAAKLARRACKELSFVQKLGAQLSSCTKEQCSSAPAEEHLLQQPDSHLAQEQLAEQIKASMADALPDLIPEKLQGARNNLHGLRAELTTASQAPDVVALNKKFYEQVYSGPGKSRAGAEVDVVAQGGSTWIEVKCYESVDLRSASWTGGATRKGMQQQAEHLLRVAQAPCNHVLWQPPTVVFHFTSNLDPNMAAELRGMGAVVTGPGPLDAALLPWPPSPAAATNLDVTTLCGLVSEVSHCGQGQGSTACAVQEWAARVSHWQGCWDAERDRPLLIELGPFVGPDRPLWASPAAITQMQALVDSYGGPLERSRWAALKSCLHSSIMQMEPSRAYTSSRKPDNGTPGLPQTTQPAPCEPFTAQTSGSMTPDDSQQASDAVSAPLQAPDLGLSWGASPAGPSGAAQASTRDSGAAALESVAGKDDTHHCNADQIHRSCHPSLTWSEVVAPETAPEHQAVPHSEANKAGCDGAPPRSFSGAAPPERAAERPAVPCFGAGQPGSDGQASSPLVSTAAALVRAPNQSRAVFLTELDQASTSVGRSAFNDVHSLNSPSSRSANDPSAAENPKDSVDVCLPYPGRAMQPDGMANGSTTGFQNLSDMLEEEHRAALQARSRALEGRVGRAQREVLAMGDAAKAVTLTANARAVHAVEAAGLHLPVYVHRAVWLTGL